MMARVAAALLVLSLGACAYRASKPVIFTYRGTVVQSATEMGPPFRTYPVSVVLSGGGPTVTRAQRAWLVKVIHSRNYGWERSKLRFVLFNDSHVPIVVYRAHIQNGIDRGGLIIGESCNAYFDPHQFGFVTTPGDAACDENAKPVK